MKNKDIIVFICTIISAISSIFVIISFFLG